jgi:hypothetical protein
MVFVLFHPAGGIEDSAFDLVLASARTPAAPGSAKALQHPTTIHPDLALLPGCIPARWRNRAFWLTA